MNDHIKKLQAQIESYAQYFSTGKTGSFEASTELYNPDIIIY